MGSVLRPQSEAELAGAIIAARTPIEVIGTATKRDLGRPVDAETILELSTFSGIHLYEPEELMIEAGAATPLAEIEMALAARNQMLAFEPPGGGTIGGVVSCNLSGPRRIKAGSARDHILGMSGVTGRGERFKAGARVVKNVTGYDLPKLLTGSYGTLAALTSVTLKVTPRPETEETAVLHGLDDTQAVAAMAQALQSPCDVSAAAHLPGTGTFLRLEGIAASVSYRREKLRALLGGEITVLQSQASVQRWALIREREPLASEGHLWRVSVPPTHGSRVMASIRNAVVAHNFYDWAGGLIWLNVPPTEDASAQLIRSALQEGHATLIHAPADARSRVEVFQPQPPALAALTRRVKEAFDPKGLLNPGRMYKGV